jgi:hypothetical protein
MQERVKVRCPWVVGVAAFLGVAGGLACSQSSFQPITYGAKPWQPPPDWNPEPACVTGYYVAIDSCEGCTGISYALCDGIRFTQCACGTSATPGAMCPQTFSCSATDFPPQGWVEFTDYVGPGWVGFGKMVDAGGGGG